MSKPSNPDPLEGRPSVETIRARLQECVEAMDAAWGDIQDWCKTARGLRERSKHPKGPDYDNVPHERGIRESERVLAFIGKVSTKASAALEAAALSQPPTEGTPTAEDDSSLQRYSRPSGPVEPEASQLSPADATSHESVQDSLMHPAHQVYFRAGLIACREYMARFVEAESPSIAMSIRANWWPHLGPDYGTPRQLDFAEVTRGEYGTPEFRIATPEELSPTQEALPVALAFLNLRLSGEAEPASNVVAEEPSRRSSSSSSENSGKAAEVTRLHCYTCVWTYKRLCRQLAEPSCDDQAAMTEVVSAIERDLAPEGSRSSEGKD